MGLYFLNNPNPEDRYANSTPTDVDG